MSDSKITLELSKSLAADPQLGHNRWHPDIEPIAEVFPGDTLDLDLRDGLDMQINAGSTIDDVVALDVRRGHPMTGPFTIHGAEPGDLLHVEILEIDADDFGYTIVIPGLGLLSDRFSEPFLVKWDIVDNVARSQQLPGIAVRGRSFLGVMGVAPSHASLLRYAQREATLAATGVLVLPPDAQSAVPGTGAVATEGLRTAPPRENGGNMDIKQLCAGSIVHLPVDVSGALFSVGDAHFAQGDGESCGVAIEMNARARLRFTLTKQRDRRWHPRTPFFEFTEDTANQGRQRFFATTGIPVDRAGQNHYLDVHLAAKNALDELVDYLTQVRGYTESQAYIIVSVASDLRISSIVNVPNAMVSAVLPLEIFEDAETGTGQGSTRGAMR